MANSIRLDASADRLDTETVVPAGASWTSCGWVKIVTDLDDETPVFTIEAIYGYPYIALRTDTDGVTPSIKLTWLSRASLGALTVGEWYFVAVRVQSSLAVSTWVGQAGGSLTRVDDTLSFGYSDPSIRYSIGGGYPGSGYLDGSFSRVRLWNAELSNADIDAEFAQDVGAARTSGLVGDWFRPDVTLSTYLADNSASNNDLTTSGTHALDTTAPDLGATGSVATADGTSTAAAVGAALAAGAATSAGVGTATATGAALASGVATSAGTGSAAATGSALASAAATSAGTSTAAATGAALASAAASSAGSSTADAVGAWTADSSGVATAAGSSTATATGAALATGQADSTGAGVATAVGAAVAEGVATSSGTSTATAVGSWTSGASGIATAAGSSTATAVGASLAAAAATASGVGAAVASGASLSEAMATASGSSTATAVGTSTSAGASVATAAGTSTVLAVGARLSNNMVGPGGQFERFKRVGNSVSTG